MISVSSNVDRVIARVRQYLAALRPESQAMVKAFTRIGIMVQAQAVLNIRRHGLIDKGGLINSIRYELFQDGGTSGVRVGSFGVPYAAAHEFGFHGTVNVRSHQRRVTKAFGRPIRETTAQVSQHSRRMNIRERSYLRPAVASQRSQIIDIIREAFHDE